MRKSLLILSLIYLSVLITAYKEETWCESCLQAVKAFLTPAGDFTLYYQLNLDNKNYQAIAYQNNFIIVTSLEWQTVADKDSPSVISSSFCGTKYYSISLSSPLAFSLQRGDGKHNSTLAQNQF